ncbi:lysophospholipase [Komagataeibacter europaeus NBRC 3261]|uniref:Lysophospholipase n=1 Tax=Komagataeibacter europaeus NBRC 3261 TaxID=1234669 RepID=A0A0D6PZY4_KOMEU|nr:GDSL-type esterase/lipase family protein [Komagataeibacter europaeus]GAN96877.1 lysophospholipase [Komagataeibacter europaeus NBRC 3261]
MLTLAIVGDSLTAGWGETRPVQLEHLNILAAGEGGQVSTQIVDRIPQVLEHDSQYVAILAGTNDIAENNGPYVEDQTVYVIKRGIQMIRAGGAKPFLCTIPPANQFCWNTAIDPKERIIRFNTRIKRLAKQEKISLVDFYPLLSNRKGGIEAVYTTDGTHLTDAAYEKMEDLLKKMFTPRKKLFGIF